MGCPIRLLAWNGVKNDEAAQSSGFPKQSRPQSDGADVACRVLAGLAVPLDVVGNFLTFVEAAQARTLDSADMDENVLAAVVGLDKAITLLIIVPLHGAGAHVPVSR